MEKAYVWTGTIEDRRSVRLDEPLPIDAERVRVTIEPLGRGRPAGSCAQLVAGIHAALSASGHVPPTKEEVARRVAEEREAWK